MLSLTGAPDVAATPADVVLVLDRSGSMAGAGLTAMQQEADALIDALDLASDGAADGTIGSGSRAGVVSFADTAAQDAALGSTPAELKAAGSEDLYVVTCFSDRDKILSQVVKEA